MTDPAPERQDQVEDFNRWLIKNGHITTDGRPIIDLRIDSSNLDVFKLLIQGVSGVCGESSTSGIALWNP